ncbi:MAG: hypothetical protein LBC61_03490 [Candidatus Peribacteria bacterium]|jgi:hypothetical protein|nr:hypothetical protein [Candidatus Peribacteria bacterium]
MLEVVLQSDENILRSKQKLGCDIYFYLPNVNKNVVDIVHKEAIKVLKRKRDVTNKTALYETIVNNLS